MRILFLTLLVLNLGFLGYHLAFGGGESVTETEPLPGQDVATLEPLPPLPGAGDGPGDPAGSTAAVSMEEAMAQATGEGKEGPGSAGSQTPSDPEPEPSPEASPSSAEAGETSSPAETPAQTPVQAPVQTPARAETPAKQPPAPQTEPPRPTCYALGPLTAELRARIEERVESTSLSVVQRWEGEHADPRYWVHLPPAPDMAGARERQEALEAAGYSDILLVRNGEMARSISLGLFADRANASQHQQGLQADGFDARIREQSRRTTAPFLGLQVPGEGAAEALAELRALVRDGAGTLTERPCDRLRKE